MKQADIVRQKSIQAEINIIMDKNYNREHYHHILSLINQEAEKGKYQIIFDDNNKENFNIVNKKDIQKLLEHDGFVINNIFSDYIDNITSEHIATKIQW